MGVYSPAIVLQDSSPTQHDIAAEVAALAALCDPDLCANPITPRTHARYISAFTGATCETTFTGNTTVPSPTSSVTEPDVEGDIRELDALCDPQLCANPITPHTRARYIAIYTGTHIVPTSDPCEEELTLPANPTPRPWHYASSRSSALASASYRADISTPIFSTRK